MTTFTEALATIHTALTALETSRALLIALRPDQRQQLTKMGDKSEAFCRQAGYVFGENPGARGDRPCVRSRAHARLARCKPDRRTEHRRTA